MAASHDKHADLPAIAFRALGELGVGIVITLDDVVVYSNDSFASMTGLDTDVVQGKAHPFLSGPIVSDGIIGQLRSSLENPEPHSPIRVDYTRADGLPAWNEVQIRKEGPYATWLHRDVTQQIATHELWQRYEFILDTSHQYMALVNQEYSYELVNRAFAAAFGTTPEEVIGSGAATVWGKSMFTAVVKPHLKTSFQGEAVQAKHWVELPVGGRRCLDMFYTPYANRDGEVIHTVFVAWDVTKEELAADNVRDANRQLEQRVSDRTKELQDTLRELEAFNYTIAHDLRTPLRFLKSFTQMLGDGSGGELTDSGHEYLGMISQGVAEMQQMIDHLLNFSRLGRQPMALTPCDLNTIVDEAQHAMLSGSLTSVTRDDLPTCMGDEALLKQVFVNLLQNAEKFSAHKEHPEIVIERADADEGMVCVCVRDNGIGFDMNHAETIFSPFKQIHEQGDHPGSGLGLAIVRRIVERHGGRVWAESEDGEGARLYVELRGA